MDLLWRKVHEMFEVLRPGCRHDVTTLLISAKEPMDKRGAGHIPKDQLDFSNF